MTASASGPVGWTSMDPSIHTATLGTRWTENATLLGTDTRSGTEKNDRPKHHCFGRPAILDVAGLTPRVVELVEALYMRAPKKVALASGAGVPA